MILKVFLILLFAFVLCFAVSQTPVPTTLGDKLFANSVACDIIHGSEIQNCKLLPGKTLDDVVQEFSDLRRCDEDEDARLKP